MEASAAMYYYRANRQAAELFDVNLESPKADKSGLQFVAAEYAKDDKEHEAAMPEVAPSQTDNNTNTVPTACWFNCLKDSGDVDADADKEDRKPKPVRRYVAEDLLGIRAVFSNLAGLFRCWTQDSGAMDDDVELTDRNINGGDANTLEDADEEAVGVSDDLEHKHHQFDHRTLSMVGQSSFHSQFLNQHEEEEQIQAHVVERPGHYSSDVPTMVVLNADPLVLNDCSKVPPEASLQGAVAIASLEAEHERTLIRKIAEDAESPVDLTFNHLSVDTLGEALTIFHPDILHLSGHGTFTRNDKDEKEYILALEGDTGATDRFSMARLTKMLNAGVIGHKRGALVFLSACYSAIAGQLFVEADYAHVIAVRPDLRVMDKTARCMARFFYSALFQGYTIAKAFEIARVNVAVAIDETEAGKLRASQSEQFLTGEAKKFILMPVGADHDVQLFPTPMQRRRLRSVSQQLLCTCGSGRSSPCTSSMPGTPRTPIQHKRRTSSTYYLPAQTEHMCGREAEVQQTIGLLNKSRCVGVFGPRKYGKTSVIKAVCHYMRNRRKFTNGILYMDMRCMESYGDFIAALVPLVDRFASTVEEEAGIEAKVFRDEPPATVVRTVSEAKEAKERSEEALHDLLLTISDWDALLVLDNAGGSLAQQVIPTLLGRTHLCKLLVATVFPLTLPVHEGFSVGRVRVQELPMRGCLKLIHNVAPWFLEKDTPDRRKFKQAITLINNSRQSPYAIRLALNKLDYGGDLSTSPSQRSLWTPSPSVFTPSPSESSFSGEFPALEDLCNEVAPIGCLDSSMPPAMPPLSQYHGLHTPVSMSGRQSQSTGPPALSAPRTGFN